MLHTPLIVRRATLTLCHPNVATTLMQLRTCTPLVNSRRTIMSSGTQKASLTDPASHKQATGIHYRPFAPVIINVQSQEDFRGQSHSDLVEWGAFTIYKTQFRQHRACHGAG